METAAHIKNTLKDFRPASQKIDLFDPNLRDNSTRVFKLKHKDGQKFKVYAFTERITIEIKIATSLHFSVNLPDNICLANKLLKNDYGLKLFCNHSQDIAILSCIGLINTDIQNLRLKSNEGLFIYKNGIQLVVDKSRELIQEILTVQKISKILECIFPDSPETIDTSKIPGNLLDLIPILYEWAISDDVEREEKISKSSKGKLKKLVDIVNPKMEVINNYLDSFKSEPLSYEATLIGNLAELVSELSLSK
jgi:hypothetical protein